MPGQAEKITSVEVLSRKCHMLELRITYMEKQIRDILDRNKVMKDEIMKLSRPAIELRNQNLAMISKINNRKKAIKQIKEEIAEFGLDKKDA